MLGRVANHVIVSAGVGGAAGTHDAPALTSSGRHLRTCVSTCTAVAGTCARETATACKGVGSADELLAQHGTGRFDIEFGGFLTVSA